MNWRLVVIPVAIGLEHFAPTQHIAIFATSGLAILPLAAWMGRATEHLAEQLGEGVGGRLNTTFGNVAPVLVLANLAVGPRPIDLVLLGGLVLSVLLTVLISGQTVADGRSDWLKGCSCWRSVGAELRYFFIPGAAP